MNQEITSISENSSCDNLLVGRMQGVMRRYNRGFWNFFGEFSGKTLPLTKREQFHPDL